DGRQFRQGAANREPENCAPGRTLDVLATKKHKKHKNEISCAFCVPPCASCAPSEPPTRRRTLAARCRIVPRCHRYRTSHKECRQPQLDPDRRWNRRSL